MSDFARLKEKLGKLRQAEPRTGAGRLLSGHDAEARLRSIVVEIDETILPRKVSFQAGASRVVIGVANRQLSLILEGAVAASEEPHVVDGRDDPILGELKDGLLRLLGGSDTWSIEVSHLDREQIAHMRPDAGVSANSLATIWGVSLTDQGATGAGDVAERFIARVADRCTAWLMIEGEEIADSGGSPAAIDWLSERAGGFLDGYFSQSETFPAGEPVALAFNGGSGASLIYFESGSQAGFATLPPDQLKDALRDWSVSLSG